jgi:hypothetical protein
MEILRKYNRPEKEVKMVELKDDIQVQAALGLIKYRQAYSSLLGVR